VSRARAFAKINLGLVVGPLRGDDRHELVTVLQRIDLHDDVELEAADELAIEGFADDTIVRDALTELAAASRVEPRWWVRIQKRIPVAAGLGGGSADAAAALRLANASLPSPLPADELHRLAARVGADVPFFLHEGAQLATGDGTDLTPLTLPTDYHVVLLVPLATTKRSTGAVYDAFDARRGADGFDAREEAFRAAVSSVAITSDLAALPANDLASSPLTAELRESGAFRADVSGAGPTVYGLFEDAGAAAAAAQVLAKAGRTFVTRPLGTDVGPGVAR
jgi:4-diphosphocytidyl-2-C-methyl-D-erythritol kinase